MRVSSIPAFNVNRQRSLNFAAAADKETILKEEVSDSFEESNESEDKEAAEATKKAMAALLLGSSILAGANNVEAAQLKNDSQNFVSNQNVSCQNTRRRSREQAELGRILQLFGTILSGEKPSGQRIRRRQVPNQQQYGQQPQIQRRRVRKRVPQQRQQQQQQMPVPVPPPPPEWRNQRPVPLPPPDWNNNRPVPLPPPEWR